jgi:hypothetical protein
VCQAREQLFLYFGCFVALEWPLALGVSKQINGARKLRRWTFFRNAARAHGNKFLTFDAAQMKNKFNYQSGAQAKASSVES